MGKQASKQASKAVAAPTANAVSKAFRHVDVTDSDAVMSLLADSDSLVRGKGTDAFVASVRADIMRGSIAVDAFVASGKCEHDKDGVAVIDAKAVAAHAVTLSWCDMKDSTMANAVGLVTKVRGLDADMRTPAGDVALSALMDRFVSYCDDSTDAFASWTSGYKLHADKFRTWITRLVSDSWTVTTDGVMSKDGVTAQSIADSDKADTASKDAKAYAKAVKSQRIGEHDIDVVLSLLADMSDADHKVLVMVVRDHGKRNRGNGRLKA